MFLMDMSKKDTLKMSQKGKQLHSLLDNGR